MVGKRIDEILAEKANNNLRSGNSYFSPIVVPVVSSFKRLYKTRLSKKTVFKGKPLHTIEESSEISQNELNSDRNFVCDQNDAHCECEQEDDDMTLSEIRNLFEIPDDRSIVDNEILLDSSLQDDISLDSPYLASPSFSLIQQFEMAAKMEAATYIQKWYRQVRDRQRFLQMKNAALVIQRHFREKR